MLKILHTNAGDNWSGIENRILIIAKHLNSEDLKVSLAISPNNPLTAKAKQENIECFNLSIRNKIDFKAVLKLKNILLEHKFDILHVHRSTDHWIGVQAVKLFNLPVKIIRTRHNYTPINPNIFNRLLYNKFTDKIITVAEIIKKDITENAHINPSKVVAIHSSIMIERFNEGINAFQIRKELNISSDIPLVGMIGRIRDHKDYPNFLEACKLVKQTRPFVKFLIVGEGPLDNEIKNLAEELGIVQDIFFLGKREDVPEVLASLDVFVLSSSVEGSPAVIKEAMVMGKPVVATSVGGIPEIIEDGVNGILVYPHSPMKLADGIIRILMDKELSEKLGRNAKKTILENFTPSVLAYKTKDVYLGVASLI